VEASLEWKGLMTLAWLKTLQGDVEKTKACLDEAWQTAERGPMRLQMADICLHRARLLSDRDEFERARELVRTTKYGRREQELADMEEAIRAW